MTCQDDLWSLRPVGHIQPGALQAVENAVAIRVPGQRERPQIEVLPFGDDFREARLQHQTSEQLGR